MQTKQSGQIAIVILLIMVVLLTVGLSLASRTTQEVFLSQQEAESTRVFNAAESGIENALSQDFSGISAETSLNNVDAENVSVVTIITPQGVLETQVTEGSVVHLDLVGLAGGAPINIEWSRQTGCDASASLITSTYYDDAGTTKVVHEAFGPASPCSGSRNTDEFTQIAQGTGTNGYTYSNTVNIPANSQYMRIMAVYDDTTIRVTGAEASNQFFVIRA